MLLRLLLHRPPRRPAFLDRRARRAAAVVAPAGFAPHIGQLVRPRRRPHILRDADPFVDRGPEDVEAAELLDDAVTHRLVVALGNEAAEHLVPDDEDAGVIGIEIARIDAVMDAVVRRSEEHTSELQSLMRISYAVYCLKKNTHTLQ